MIMAHKAPSGEIAFLSTMVRDITERKQIEQAQAGAVSDSRARAQDPHHGRLRVPRDDPRRVPRGRRSAGVHDATGLLCHLVDDILDIEKLESGAMDFAFEEVDLVLLVEHAVRVNRVYAAQFGVEFELVGSRSGLRVWADGGRLMQVLTNLFSNAAKFSHSDNTAVVRVKRVGSTARVSVSNYGEPIPYDVRAELFEKFVQARSKEKPRTGTGMGLAISKAIVAHHSGRIGFETSRGGRTTLSFDVPLLDEAARGGPARDGEKGAQAFA